MPGPVFRTKEFTGQTLTVDVVRLDTDAVVESGIALTEATNADCIYTSAAMTSAPPVTGMYAVLVKSGSDLIRTYYAYLLTTDTSGTVDLYDWPVDTMLARGVLTVPASGNWSTHSAADVWAVGTRTLTGLDEDATTIDLDATIRTAIGLATANLDTQLADIPTVSEFDARTLAAADYFDPAADTVANVTTVATTTNLTNLPAITANWLTAAGLAADAVSEIQSGLATSTALSTLATQVGTAGNGLTAVPWNAAWDAEVQSEVQDAIEANHLDHLLAQTYDPASKPGAADALLNELVESDAGVSRFTTNALEQAPAGGGGGGATAEEINDYLVTEHGDGSWQRHPSAENAVVIKVQAMP